MRGMTLEKIAGAVGGQLYLPSQPANTENVNKVASVETAEATAVVIDSRKIEPGAVFVATRGERADGHDYINQVFEKGALGVICEHLPKDGSADAEDGSAVLHGPCIVVENSFVALKALAKYYRDRMSDVKIVGIVGSVGKTSTKELVASVLEQKYRTLKTEGNFNNEIGVPLTILRLRDEHEAAVVEMGISNFDEMDRLGTIVRPDAVVMTNIGPCHLEFLGDLDGVLKAKSEVFTHIRKCGLLALNAEDEKLKGIIAGRKSNVSNGCSAHELRDDVRIAGYGKGSEYEALNVKSLGLEGTEFTVKCREKSENEFATKVPLPGIHMVQNALAATAIGREFGLSFDEIARGIESVKPVSGRSNLIRTDNYLIVDDCYNANPKSMMAAVDLMSEALGRKCCIFGDMFELGENEYKLHAEVGEYAVRHGIDLLVCVGERSKYMYEAACAVQGAAARTEYFENREKLLAGLDGLGLSKGDTILVKASHGMGFAEVVEALKK